VRVAGKERIRYTECRHAIVAILGDRPSAHTDRNGAFHSGPRALRPILQARFSPDGFNVGANCGPAAGQSVWHAHIHVIPRYKGDTPNPRGGVRHVIPLKGNY